VNTPTEAGPPSPPAGARLTWLAAALLIAAVIQVAVVLRSPLVGKDSILFAQIARDLARDPAAAIRAAYQHPGYPAMVLAAHSIIARVSGPDAVRSWVRSLYLVSGVCGIFNVVALWLLAQRALDAQMAGVAAVLFAVLPLFRQEAADGMSDTPHLLFYLLALWLLLEGLVRRRWAYFALAGAASGAAYWIRPEGLSVALVGAALLGWQFLRLDRSRRCLFFLGGLLLAAGIVAAPYVLIKGRITEKKDVTSLFASKQTAAPSSGAAVASGPAAGPAAAPEETASSPPPARPGLSARMPFRWLAELAQRYLLAIRYFLLLPLAVAIFWKASPRPRREARVLLAAVAVFHLFLLFLLFAIAGYLDQRHVMVLVVVTLLWAAAGMVAVAEWLSSGGLGEWARRFSPGALVIFFAAACVAGLAPRSLRPEHTQWVPLLKAAQWLRTHADADDRILSNSPYVLFYADRQGILVDTFTPFPPPDGPAECRYAVFERLDKHFLPEWLPELRKRYVEFQIPGLDKGAPDVLVMQLPKH
jgi:4-amino-4-deoxy-L-arabinose transferase-like glycosyltransferase